MRNKLKCFRVAAGLTRSMVAGAVGVSLPGYQRLEDGQMPISNRKLRKLAKVLQVTPEAILDKHPPLGVSLPYLGTGEDEQLVYYGEVAFHFARGGAPLLLSISEAAFHDLYGQLLHAARFVRVKSLSNQTVVLRTDAIADVCFSSEAYDDIDMSGNKYDDYPDYISTMIPDPRDWEIIELAAVGAEGLESFDRADVQRVTERITVPDSLYDRLVSTGQLTLEDLPAERRRNEKAAELIKNAAHSTMYQLSSGARRSVYSCEPSTLYEAFRSLIDGDAHTFQESMIALPAEGWHRSVFINTDAIDYVMLPTHQYIKGATEFHAKRLDALEPKAKSGSSRGRPVSSRRADTSQGNLDSDARSSRLLDRGC